MGATLQWREPPEDRRNRSYRRSVEFGRGRSAGSGYMAYSDRVGPSVLILSLGDERVARGLADRLNQEGFTALAVDVADARDPTRRATAGAQFLVENWHPRLGVVCIGRAAGVALELARAGSVEALVAYDAPADLDLGSWDLPLLLHARGAVAGELEAAVAQLDNEVDAEVSAYRSLDGEELEVAHARTVEVLRYYVS